jgi:hypothetical protein
MAVVKAVHGRVGEVTNVVLPTQFPAGMGHERDGVEVGASRLMGIEGLDLVEVALEDAAARGCTSSRVTWALPLARRAGWCRPR